MAASAMVQAILEGVTRRTEHLRSLTDPSRGESVQPEFLLDVIEGLRTCALLRDYLAESAQFLWMDVLKSDIENYDLVGRMYLMSIAAAQKTYETVRRRAEEANAITVQHEIAQKLREAQQAFDKAVADVESLRRDFQERWPWINQEQFHRSVAAERQGAKCRSMKEIHDELRSKVRRMG